MYYLMINSVRVYTGLMSDGATRSVTILLGEDSVNAWTLPSVAISRTECERECQWTIETRHYPRLWFYSTASCSSSRGHNTMTPGAVSCRSSEP